MKHEFINDGAHAVDQCVACAQTRDAASHDCAGSVAYEPEGVLSRCPCCATAMSERGSIHLACLACCLRYEFTPDAGPIPAGIAAARAHFAAFGRDLRALFRGRPTVHDRIIATRARQLFATEPEIDAEWMGLGGDVPRQAFLDRAWGLPKFSALRIRCEVRAARMVEGR